MTVSWSLRPCSAEDAEWIVSLKAEVMRADLERLGRWDPDRSRRRVLDAFDPAHTWIIVVDGADVGSIAVRPASDALWIEHFYLLAAAQGRGIGSAVLQDVLRARQDGRPFRLNVLQGSRARQLHERNGFVLEREDPIDVFLVADAPQTATTSTS